MNDSYSICATGGQANNPKIIAYETGFQKANLQNS